MKPSQQKKSNNKNSKLQNSQMMFGEELKHFFHSISLCIYHYVSIYTIIIYTKMYLFLFFVCGGVVFHKNPHEQCSFHPGWLFYIEDEKLPSYNKDYFINHEIRIPFLTKPG